MSDVREVTIALDRYDRHFPFFDGTVKAPVGVRYRALQVGQVESLRDGIDRHGQMIHNRAFDVAEFSMSTFLMAIDRGLPIIGIPVFPRRLFSQSCFFVRPDSDIEHPRDLVGRRVGLLSFQTTLSLLAKGDLKFEYGVEWEQIKWLLTTDEKVQYQPKPGVVIDHAPNGTDLGVLLGRGEIDAICVPHPPHSVMKGHVPTRRLFKDSQAEEKRYFDKYGWWPIMHIIAMHRDLVAREPELPHALMEMFAQAHEICDDYYTDPNWSRLPWIRYAYEQSQAAFGNPWVNGFRKNKANLEQFIMYSHDQGLIGERYAAERLFVDTTLDS
jgi:4,5-dihydroxyphthalate decarboxylase